MSDNTDIFSLINQFGPIDETTTPDFEEARQRWIAQFPPESFVARPELENVHFRYYEPEETAAYYFEYMKTGGDEALRRCAEVLSLCEAIRREETKALEAHNNKNFYCDVIAVMVKTVSDTFGDQLPEGAEVALITVSIAIAAEMRKSEREAWKKAKKPNGISDEEFRKLLSELGVDMANFDVKGGSDNDK